jgi:hypothetical protein
VVFDRLDHHGMLEVGAGDLHAAACADPGVRDIAIASDFIGCIDNDDAFVQFGRQNARSFAQQCGLAYARPAEQKQALSRFDDIAKNVDCAQDRAADPAGQADDDVSAIAYRGNSVQSPLDAGAIIERKGAHTVNDVVEILAGYR